MSAMLLSMIRSCHDMTAEVGKILTARRILASMLTGVSDTCFADYFIHLDSWMLNTFRQTLGGLPDILPAGGVT